MYGLAKGWRGFVALKVAKTRNDRFFGRGRRKPPMGKQGFFVVATVRDPNTLTDGEPRYANGLTGPGAGPRTGPKKRRIEASVAIYGNEPLGVIAQPITSQSMCW